MSKILIIYPYLNQEPMVFHLVNSLRNNGLQVDAINSFNLQFAIKPIQEVQLKFRFIPLLSKLPLPKWKGFLFSIFDKKKALLKIANSYDIIDFHSFIAEYDSLIKELSAKKIIKVTFWGSDFYRATNERREQQRIALQFADSIQIGTLAMKSDIMEHFGEFEDKVRIANFGLQQFDLISELKKANYVHQYKKGENRDKLMVVCGYNGSKAQQHFIMIDALNKLKTDIKQKIFVVFPMTYGADSSYLKSVETELKRTNISYFILTKHLSEIEMAKLRIDSDIVVNIQKTDAFSGSLQQHLFSENVVLVGDWLPYSVLDDHKVFLKRTTIENLYHNISDCINNFDTLTNLARGNCEKMAEISSLKITGKRIAAIYNELQS